MTLSVSISNTTTGLPDFSDHISRDQHLPSFNQSVEKTFIAPRVSFEASKVTQVENLKIQLLQKSSHWRTVIAIWSVTSLEGLRSPVEYSGSFEFPLGPTNYELTAFIPSFMPESVDISTGDNFLSYFLHVTWSENALFSTKNTQQSFPYHFRRNYEDSNSLSFSSNWESQAIVMYTFESDTLSFEDKIDVKISVSPLTKSLRLVSIVFSILENGREVKIWSQSSEEMKVWYQKEVENITKLGLSYKRHFFDTCNYGNLLTNENHSQLRYTFDLTKFTSQLNPSTKGTHPVETRHVIQTVMRFSFLKRRFFDHRAGEVVLQEGSEDGGREDCSFSGKARAS